MTSSFRIGFYEKWAFSATHGTNDATFFEKGAKIIHRQFQGGEFRVDGNTEVRSCKDDDEVCKILTADVPRDATDFLARGNGHSPI